MNYILEDWRDANHCKLSFFTDLNAAEGQAVQLMDEIKDQLPSKAWGRGEWSLSSNVQEYIERGAVGSALRVYQIDIPRMCSVCRRVAMHWIRAGYFCDKHYDEWWQEEQSE